VEKGEIKERRVLCLNGNQRVTNFVIAFSVKIGEKEAVGKGRGRKRGRGGASRLTPGRNVHYSSFRTYVGLVISVLREKMLGWE